MGVDTKALRNRIKSVNSTLHLTKAMGLVASSKIRRATDAMLKGREYSRAVEDVVTLLLSCPSCRNSSFAQKREGGKTCLVIVAGDRGLAGGYNANIFRTYRDMQLEENFPCEIIPIGKRSFDRYRSKASDVTEEAGSAAEAAAKDEEEMPCFAESFRYADALSLSKRLCAAFSTKTYDRVGILHTEYHSMLLQKPVCSWILPLQAGDAKPVSTLLFEPGEGAVLAAAVQQYVAGKLFAAVRESFACEVAARRMAMDSAGKNAQQMIDDLQLSYNRARQGAITQEITEIVAGAGS